jgi:hypothetical protein
MHDDKNSVVIPTSDIDDLAAYYSGKREAAIRRLLKDKGAPMLGGADLRFDPSFRWLRESVDWDPKEYVEMDAVRISWYESGQADTGIGANSTSSANVGYPVSSETGFREATENLCNHLLPCDEITLSRVQTSGERTHTRLVVDKVKEYRDFGHITWTLFCRGDACSNVILNDMVYYNGEILTLFDNVDDKIIIEKRA